MPISQDQITTLDQLEEKLTLALTDLLLLRDSNNEDYKVKASTILQAAVDKAGAELIGGNVESGNNKAVTGDTVNTTLDSYAKSYNYDATKLDFNDFIKTGFYRIGNIASYSNAPSEAKSYGQLIVSHNGDTTTQIYISYNDKGRMFTRCFNDSLSGGVTWEPIITETLLNTALLPKQTVQTFETPAWKSIKITLSHTSSIFAVKITIQGASGGAFGSLQWQGYGPGTYDNIAEIIKGDKFNYTKSGQTLEITLPIISTGFYCCIENIINGHTVTYAVEEITE